MARAIRRTQGKVRGTAPATAKMRRKNMNMDQEKLDRLVAYLGVSSETEAVDHAIDMVLFHQDVIAGVRELAARGGVEDYLDEDVDWWPNTR